MCRNCGAILQEGALYCHKCGSIVNPSNIPPQSRIQADYSNLGLLLIKVGAIVAFIMPALAFTGIGSVAGMGIFSSMQGMFYGMIAVFIAIGIIFGILALKFHKDIVAGESKRIVHTIILGVIMFVLGSNVAGALVGIGAFLCYLSPISKNQ